jgi:hypothetical protein
LAAARAAVGLFTSGVALWQARAMTDHITQTMSRNNFLTVPTFAAIVTLVILNVMRRFPGLGTLIAQYNQF